MINNFAHLNIFSSELEINCIELIEYELTDFFNLCSKSASSYSLMVAQNLKTHNKVNFEEMVLNYDVLMVLMQNIIHKLRNSLNISNINYEEDMKDEFDEKYINLNTLNNTVIQNKITHNITISCEKVMDKAISNSLIVSQSWFISDYLLNKVEFGTLILGNNNSKNLTEKCEKELYNQIEGLLRNIKMDFRILIIKNVMEKVKDCLCIDMIA